MPALRTTLEGISRNKRVGVAIAFVGLVMMGTALIIETISVDRIEAVWAVNNEVGESSQVIPIRAAHPECPSWSQLGGLVVDSIETDDAVIITATFPEHHSDEPCHRRGTTMQATVKLDEPLGDRVVIDGSSGTDPSTPLTIAFYIGESPGSPG